MDGQQRTLLNQIMGWTHSDWDRMARSLRQMAFATKQLRKCCKRLLMLVRPFLTQTVHTCNLYHPMR